jgi:glycosyltransferase involved in cell wall biosynthesis
MIYPKISIVTQCFNRKDSIAETIESVLNQGYPNLEYIVIDDGSTDGSWEIIQRYKDRLTLCEQLPGTRDNPAEAVQYGLGKTTGEVMSWLFSKNILLPKSLFTIAQVFAELPEVEWLTAYSTMLDSEGKIVGVNPVRKDLYEHLIGGRDNIQQESTFWRRSLWESTGASLETEKIAIDVTLWSTRFFPAARLYHLTTVLGAWRKSASSFSGTRRERFYADIADARKRLWQKMPLATRIRAHLFRGIRFGKPLLRNIPDSVWTRLPFLRDYAHTAIRFTHLAEAHPRLEVYKRNPFRTIYPW